MRGKKIKALCILINKEFLINLPYFSLKPNLMSINIKALNVGDGDCIILTISNAKGSKVVLIDGGDNKSTVTSTVLDQLAAALKAAGREAPDLVVCTHYDDDHIWGLIKVAEQYGAAIGECWVLRPPEEYGNFIRTLESAVLQKNTVVDPMRTESMALVAGMKQDPLVEEEAKFLIESYNSLQIFLDRLSGVKITEPFAEKGTHLDGFPGFKAVGPPESFYQRFLKTHTSKQAQLSPDFLFGEMSAHRKAEQELLTEKASGKEAVTNPCDKLGKKSISKVSAVNMVSIICTYEENGRTYLFPGDAGIESFEAIPGFQKSLKDLEFMMVQHHGALYNISSELIGLFNPRTAFVSAKGKLESGVVKRPHPDVMACFKAHGIEVHRTQDCENYLEYTEAQQVAVH